MKKIVLWFMSTLTALVLLFGYHTSTSTTAAASAESSAVAPVSSGTAAGATAAVPSTGTTTYTGSAAATKYGPVQVEVTVTNGTVTDVEVIDYPNDSGKDQQINARALPVLVQETLDAQSAGIDMVSGATYTSDGYVQSLQSALDQAGL